MSEPVFHLLEDVDSRQGHLDRLEAPSNSLQGRRRLKHHHHHHQQQKQEQVVSPDDLLEQAQEDQFWQHVQENEKHNAKIRRHNHKKRTKRMHELYANPGIASNTAHGLMIDAGSTGSRMHLYEWEPRVLSNAAAVDDAVSGKKLSFPKANSRWTDRLQPGLASFASIADDEQLRQEIADYLQPLLNFAQTVLHEKQAQFGDYPIYLRATAGMRMLDTPDRARVMGAVRDLFSNKTYCPFAFEDEQARVLSGEEEAIFDWTGVNFLLGDLIDASQGAGTVLEPQLTHGALDLGGASTQIGFYEPHEDIMANLFKLQIGQAKHWNLYAHSFLSYGVNEATSRFYARLVAGKTTEERLVDGIYNPCMPRGFETKVRSEIQLSDTGVEKWDADGEGFYHAILKNDNVHGDPDQCLNLVKDLLHLEKNDWCEFAHKGDCSFAGVYQPDLPTLDTSNFGEFVAFSNYYHIWQFLQLPERATIAQLHDATRHVCSLSRDELIEFNKQGSNVEDDELHSYCFRSAYAFQLLYNGYGFRMTDTIRAARVINGHKVGWALGAMLYEINTMPWKYDESKASFRVEGNAGSSMEIHSFFLVTVAAMAAMTVGLVFFRHLRRHRHGYKKVYDSEYEPFAKHQTNYN